MRFDGFFNRWTGAVGVLSLFGLMVGLLVTRGSHAAQRVNAETVRRSNSSRQAVIVELFTSEGCSSCPSADLLLARLQKEQPVSGVDIVPLSEHVDYWNYIGWKDPFSSEAFTQRQREYARVFQLQSVYTPQMVVSGQMQFVGSEGAQALNSIQKAANLPHASVQISQMIGEAGAKNTPPLQIRVNNLPEVSSGDTAMVFLAITEDNLISNVRRGENTGRTLPHTAVVRQLKSLGEITARTPFTSASSLTLDATWKRKDLSAVVFVQERKSGHILGAAKLSLAQ